MAAQRRHGCAVPWIKPRSHFVANPGRGDAHARAHDRRRVRALRPERSGMLQVRETVRRNDGRGAALI